jgi:hypothetical protein
MAKSNFKKYKRLILLVVILIAISSCDKDIHIAESNFPQSTNTPMPSPIVSIQESAVVYTNFKEITDRSDVIIIGTSIAQKVIVNIARDPNDHTMPDPLYFSIGQIYEIQVDRYLKGDGTASIYVIQNEGFMPLGSQEPTNDDIDKAKKLSDSAPLVIGRVYIMFLSYHDPEYSYDDFPIKEFLFAKGHPWRFEITNTGCVQPEDGITDLYIYFPSTAVNEFIQYINKPTTFPEVPYPAPLSANRCSVSNISTTPYP